MLLNYQGEGNVTTCSECASVPVWLSRWLFDGSLKLAAIIAVVLLIALTLVFLSFRRSFLKSPDLLVTAALLTTLLASPYLYNYDFILLLVPFAILINSVSTAEKIVVGLSYLTPSIVIILAGREGNITLNAVTIVMIFLVFLQARRVDIDVPVFASYNVNN
jgi:hypothetical protein